MPLVLLGSNIDTAKFFNLNQVAGEILSAFTGSISLLACVPLTAIMSAWLIKRKQFKLEKAKQAKEQKAVEIEQIED